MGDLEILLLAGAVVLAHGACLDRPGGSARRRISAEDQLQGVRDADDRAAVDRELPLSSARIAG